jgi:hypothetical protein
MERVQTPVTLTETVSVLITLATGCVLNAVANSLCLAWARMFTARGNPSVVPSHYIECTVQRGCFHPQCQRNLDQQRQLWLLSCRNPVRILTGVHAALCQVSRAFFQSLLRNTLEVSSYWQILSSSNFVSP